MRAKQETLMRGRAGALVAFCLAVCLSASLALAGELQFELTEKRSVFPTWLVGSTRHFILKANDGSQAEVRLRNDQFVQEGFELVVNSRYKTSSRYKDTEFFRYESAGKLFFYYAIITKNAKGHGTYARRNDDKSFFVYLFLRRSHCANDIRIYLDGLIGSIEPNVDRYIAYLAGKLGMEQCNRPL